MSNDLTQMRDALRFVPSHERELWVRMGMAVKSAVGENGKEIWIEWGASDDSFKLKDAEAVWRSISPFGGIGPGTLYAEAKKGGWRGAEPTRTPADDTRHRKQAIEAARMESQKRERAARDATQAAMKLVNEAHRANHPYLAAKGFAGEVMYVNDGNLIVPMWDSEAYGKRLNSAQKIAEDGTKKFLYGGRAKGSIYRIGSGAEAWLCEGLATGLSVRDAMKMLYRKVTVVVCFSAGNLAHIAKTIPGIVVADNDESGTGERVARETGHRWWMPPDVNTDANDFHQRYGLRNLATILNRARAD